MRVVFQLSLLLVLSLTLFAGCGEKPPPEPVSPDPDAGRQPDTTVQVRGGQIFLADDSGNRLWEASAAVIEGDFIKGEGTMQEVKCALFENDTPILQAQADQAYYRPEKREVVLEGKVQAQWPEKSAKAQADKMIWSLKSRKMVASGDVLFVRGEESIRAEKLSADFNLRTIEALDGEE